MLSIVLKSIFSSLYDNYTFLQLCHFYQTMAGAIVRLNYFTKPQIGKNIYIILPILLNRNLPWPKTYRMVYKTLKLTQINWLKIDY